MKEKIAKTLNMTYKSVCSVAVLGHRHILASILLRAQVPKNAKECPIAGSFISGEG